MVSKNFTVTNKTGLHMRPAQTWVKAMKNYSSDINIKFNGNNINGKSILNIMAACIKCGSNITVECSGEDEEKMLSEAALLIESGFGE